jgi:hypothetical protein
MAKLEACPICGNKTSANANQCPACGEPLSAGWADVVERKRRKNIRFNLAVLGLLVLGVIGVAFYDDAYLTISEQIAPERYQSALAERDASRIKELEAEVAKVPVLEFDENIRLYRELQALAPTNTRYAAKIEYYTGQKDKAAKEAEAKRQLADAKRRRQGLHCLSSWDGSHRGVERATKKRLRDPDSFEHIDTRIWPVNPSGAHELVMRYRAANGFGGINTASARAIIKNGDCSAIIKSIQ